MKNINSGSSGFFRRNTSGSMFLEFVLTIPLLILIFYGMVEFSRFALIKQKMSNANTSIVNLLNQVDKDGMDKATLDYITAALPESLRPYESQNWDLVVNAVYQKVGTDCDIYSLWQVKRGSLDARHVSEVAPAQDKKANIKGYETKFKPGDQLITVEVFMTYKPLINNFFVKLLGLQDHEIYSFFVARPRYGAFAKNPETGTVINPVCKVTA